MPFAPFLYLQGQRTRRNVGVLPGAGGETSGRTGDGIGRSKLLVIGESTVAGLGARSHELALAGQFAARLSPRIGKTVNWTAVGKNGVTANNASISSAPPTAA